MKPGFNIPIKFQSLVAGMEDDRLCLEKMGPKEGLEEPVEGDFLDSPVGASGAQVHEGSVDRCLQPIFLKGCGQSPEVLFVRGIEIVAAEVDLGMNPVCHGKVDPIVQHWIRDIHVDVSSFSSFFSFSIHGSLVSLVSPVSLVSLVSLVSFVFLSMVIR